jgi:uncharacterized protein (DUF58 family)
MSAAGPSGAASAAHVLNPVAYARRRFRQWWQARLPLADSVTLTQRNVYILPTAPGFMLLATLLVLLVGSINYQLNLGYLLTFLLAGSGVVSMHLSHATLRGVTLSLLQPDPQFAGTNATLSVVLGNGRSSPRHSVGLAVLDAGPTGHWAWTDVPAQGTAVVHVAFSPGRRGLHRVPPLTAETRFPLGTFRVWTVWRPAAEVLVYPAPEPNPPPLPPGEPIAGGAQSVRLEDTGEFDGVRAYRRGDPLKQVVWKKVAKANELVSREQEQAQRYQLWLDLSQTAGRDLEQRLSRLTAWVLRADDAGASYGLRLPGRTVPPGSGPAHKRLCLEALATC